MKDRGGDSTKRGVRVTFRGQTYVTFRACQEHGRTEQTIGAMHISDLHKTSTGFLG